MGTLLNIKEAAALLGVHPETLRTWARGGKVPSIKAGRHWRFERERLVESLRTAEPAARQGD